MIGLLTALWGLIAGGFRTLILGNSESRADFTAIVDALQEDNKELRNELKRLDAKLDEVESEVFTLRAENYHLKQRLSDSDRQHKVDEATIASLTARITSIEQGANGGGS
jgi:regulator of replication initiation timing